MVRDAIVPGNGYLLVALLIVIVFFAALLIVRRRADAAWFAGGAIAGLVPWVVLAWLFREMGL